MTQATSAAGISQFGTNGGNSTKKLNELDIDDFLKLMISELRNQDPLNPMDNKDMLAQISQIRAIGSNDKLTATLDTVLRGQNFSSATSMIGKKVTGLDITGSEVTGVVDRVTVADGVNTLHVGEKQLRLSNIRESFQQYRSGTRAKCVRSSSLRRREQPEPDHHAPRKQTAKHDWQQRTPSRCG